MNTDDLPQKPQEAENNNLARRGLLLEISSILSSADSAPPHPVMAEAAEEMGASGLTSDDLNVTGMARQVDSLFLHRWLEGIGSGKPHLQPASFPQSARHE